MFWNKFPLFSQLETLLDKENVTLDEVLDEDDVIEECKSQNRKLIDFLVQKDNIISLVKATVEEPPDDLSPQLRYRLPHIASELLCANVNEINNALVDGEECLNQLYYFFRPGSALVPLAASFVQKIFVVLLQRKGEVIVSYLQKQGDFIDRILEHLNASAVVDLLLRLVQSTEPWSARMDAIEILNKGRFVHRLIAQLTSDYDEERHASISHCLCDLLYICRDQGQTGADSEQLALFLDTLESCDTIVHLLNQVFTGDGVVTESIVVNALQYVQALLDRRKSEVATQEMPLPSTEMDLTRWAKWASQHIVQAVVPQLAGFKAVLERPPLSTYSEMPTTVGVLSPPLGQARLHTVRLVQDLIDSRSCEADTAIHEHNLLGLIVDLFFCYRWNTFLHATVECVLCAVLTNGLAEDSGTTEPLVASSTTKVVNGGSVNLVADIEDAVANTKLSVVIPSADSSPDSGTVTDGEANGGGDMCQSAEENGEVLGSPPVMAPIQLLAKQLLTNIDLMTRILDAWEENNKDERTQGGRRHGYMGHLRRIANVLAESLTQLPERCPLHKEIMTYLSPELRQRWDTFVQGQLSSLNAVNRIDYNAFFDPVSSSEDEDVDYISDAAVIQCLQTAYHDYQTQSITSPFIDTFGYSEEEFCESESKADTRINDRFESIDFSLATHEDTPNAAMFEQACNEVIRQFDDDEEEEAGDVEAVTNGTAIPTGVEDADTESAQDGRLLVASSTEELAWRIGVMEDGGTLLPPTKAMLQQVFCPSDDREDVDEPTPPPKPDLTDLHLALDDEGSDDSDGEKPGHDGYPVQDEEDEDDDDDDYLVSPRSVGQSLGSRGVGDLGLPRLCLSGTEPKRPATGGGSGHARGILPLAFILPRPRTVLRPEGNGNAETSDPPLLPRRAWVSPRDHDDEQEEQLSPSLPNNNNGEDTVGSNRLEEKADEDENISDHSEEIAMVESPRDHPGNPELYHKHGADDGEAGTGTTQTQPSSSSSRWALTPRHWSGNGGGSSPPRTGPPPIAPRPFSARTPLSSAAPSPEVNGESQQHQQPMVSVASVTLKQTSSAGQKVERLASEALATVVNGPSSTNSQPATLRSNENSHDSLNPAEVNEAAPLDTSPVPNGSPI